MRHHNSVMNEFSHDSRGFLAGPTQSHCDLRLNTSHLPAKLFPPHHGLNHFFKARTITQGYDNVQRIKAASEQYTLKYFQDTPKGDR